MSEQLYNSDANIFHREIEPSDDLKSALFGGWQDISTAPKDGTHILVEGGEAYWNGEYWFSCSAQRLIQWDVRCWMPLPKPPSI